MNIEDADKISIVKNTILTFQLRESFNFSITNIFHFTIIFFLFLSIIFYFPWYFVLCTYADIYLRQILALNTNGIRNCIRFGY